MGWGRKKIRDSFRAESRNSTGSDLLRVETDQNKGSADIKRVRQQIRRTRDLPTAPLADVHPFHPPIQLIYRGGPQAGESEILGFGPRRFGSGVLDIEMMDPQVAELAFELRMGPGGLEILCQQSGVRVNGNPVRHHLLAEGDWIEVGQSVLEVKTYTDTDGKEDI
ncbi:MAG: FHA domain-containing protein [Bdellovibrio sp.]